MPRVRKPSFFRRARPGNAVLLAVLFSFSLLFPSGKLSQPLSRHQHGHAVTSSPELLLPIARSASVISKINPLPRRPFSPLLQVRTLEPFAPMGFVSLPSSLWDIVSRSAGRFRLPLRC